MIDRTLGEKLDKAFSKHYQGRLPLVVTKEGGIEQNA
jgi:hypothetical protein